MNSMSQENVGLTKALDMAHRQLSRPNSVRATQDDILDLAILLEDVPDQYVILHRATLMAAADDMIGDIAAPYQPAGEAFFPHLEDYRVEKAVLTAAFGRSDSIKRPYEKDRIPVAA